jgi:cytochrome c oxidase assembly factor CtaG
MSALGHIYILVGALLFWLKIINNLLLKSWEIKVMDDHRGDLLSWNLRVSSKLYKFQLDPVVNLFICFS